MPAQVKNVDNDKTLQVRGLVDTGSTYCAITRDMANALGLASLGRVPIMTAIGEYITDLYFIGIRLPDNHRVYELGATGCAPQEDFDMLIGRNVIRLGLLEVTEHQFSLSQASVHQG